MFRRIAVLSIAVFALTLLAVPAAQAQDDGDYVSLASPMFSWTGKQDQNANYSWSATVENPFKRPVTVRVTLVLVDGAGDVVSSTSETVEVDKEGSVDVGGEGMLAYAQANQARQYRIEVAAAD